MGLPVHTNPSQAELKASVDGLLVNGLSFNGNTVVSQSELEALTQPYVGCSLTLSGLPCDAWRRHNLMREPEGAVSLTANSTGTMTFSGAIGNTTSLTSLITNLGDSTTIKSTAWPRPQASSTL